MLVILEQSEKIFYRQREKKENKIKKATVFGVIVKQEKHDFV